MTTTTARFWANDNGAICCQDHAGHYLSSAISARPRAKTHRTPLGTYELLNNLEVTFLSTEYGEICENCRSAR